MSRQFDNVFKNICNILLLDCHDDILLNKWTHELKWFDTFNKERYTKYWNIAPEMFETMKWRKLHNIVNSLIPNKTPVHVWEKKIVNVFLDKHEYDETTVMEENQTQNAEENELEWYNLIAIGKNNLLSNKLSLEQNMSHINEE